MSLSLLSLVPASVRFASTWKEAFFDRGVFKEQNMLMPLGFSSLAIESIGLMILWTAYKRNERWAWFAMQIIIALFVFPYLVLPILMNVQTQGWEWFAMFRNMFSGPRWMLWMLVGVLNCVMMQIALLLPVRAFFSKPGRLD